MVSQITQQTRQHLQQNRNDRLIMVIPSLLSAAACLVVFFGSYAFTLLAPEGGLSHLDYHRNLSIGRILAQLLLLILISMGNSGLRYVSLRKIREETVATADIFESFRQFLPVICSGAVRFLRFLLMIWISSNVSALMLGMLPWPQSIVDELLLFMEVPAYPLSTNMQLVLIVYGLIFAATFVFLPVPSAYRDRMSSYYLYDDGPYPLQAIGKSRLLMQRNRRKLAQLDRHYWWYHLLNLLLGITAHSLIAVNAFGMPIGDLSDLSICSIAAILVICQCVLQCFAKPGVYLSEALFYEQLRQAPKEQPKDKTAPAVSKSKPWNY